jgi:hypothetical protein
MFGRLLPKEVSFFDFFEKHVSLIYQGIKEYQTIAKTSTNISHHVKRVKEIEHEADGITHFCVESLHKTFITPIERDDIFKLISTMDDVIDHVDAACSSIDIYKITTMTPEAIAYADILISAVVELEKALKGLRNMNNSQMVREACICVNRLENEGDRITRQAFSRLFEEEPDIRTLIKWKEIYQHLEDAIDCCEDVANIIEGVILEQD